MEKQSDVDTTAASANPEPGRGLDAVALVHHAVLGQGATNFPVQDAICSPELGHGLRKHRVTLLQ